MICSQCKGVGLSGFSNLNAKLSPNLVNLKMVLFGNGAVTEVTVVN